VTEVRGWRLHAWGGPVAWETFDVPDPGPGEVLVEVDACGVGLTVLNCIDGQLADSDRMLPLTPGHEVVGRVVSMGAGVEHPAVGDRVLAYFYLSCFRCRACLQGRESRCDHLAGWYGVHRSGGYAPLTVLPAGNAIPLEADLPADVATVIPDALSTPVHVCRRRLELGPGDRVAVIGAGGGVGAHMVQVAAVCGATVMGLDVTDAKLSLIEELGATPVRSSDLASTELPVPESRADAIIDLVGTADTLAWGMDHLARGGRLCLLTTFRDATFRVAPRELVFREASVIGSRYASRSELRDATDLVASGAVRPIVGNVVPAREVDVLHEQLRAGTLNGRGAIVWD
jgi:D-arabinose 1-dehydrogenase-like Zn-dependent alcohol dehydrogenase